MKLFVDVFAKWRCVLRINVCLLFWPANNVKVGYHYYIWYVLHWCGGGGGERQVYRDTKLSDEWDRSRRRRSGGVVVFLGKLFLEHAATRGREEGEENWKETFTERSYGGGNGVREKEW